MVTTSCLPCQFQLPESRWCVGRQFLLTFGPTFCNVDKKAGTFSLRRRMVGNSFKCQLLRLFTAVSRRTNNLSAPCQQLHSTLSQIKRLLILQNLPLSTSFYWRSNERRLRFIMGSHGFCSQFQGLALLTDRIGQIEKGEILLSASLRRCCRRTH